MNVKFLVAYHKPDILFNSEMIIPIHVGRARLKARAETDDAAKANLQFLENAMIGDDTGDNISLKNGSYNELTALYWAWKNYDKIGNPTHIGLMHYRRHFIFKDLENTFNECNDVGVDYLENDLNFTKDVVESILSTHDFITKKPAKFDRVYDAYLANHRPENMAEAIKILKEKFPKYASSCDKYMEGTDCYYLNMFVFPKEIFFEYCTYMFGILGEFEKRIDTSRMRFFISEFLTGIFIQYLCDSGYNGAFYPTMYIEEQATIPAVYEITAENLLQNCVSVSSLLRNLKKSSKCVLVAVCRQSEKDLIKSKLSQITDKYENCKLEFVEVDDAILHKNIYDDLQIYAISNITYGKALFMSSDAICKGDITGFFRNSVDDYAIAAVKENVTIKVADEELVNAGLKDLTHYINCGVMLVNLNRLKQFDMAEGVSNLYSATNYTAEQVINAVCFEQIRLMPLRQNFLTSYYEASTSNSAASVNNTLNYTQNEIAHANKTALIVNYDGNKPWLDSLCFRAKDWFYHEDLSGYYDDLKKGVVSIVMPIYNAEKYIADALNSLLKQSYSDFEIICVNDGSTDDTEQIIRKFVRKNRKIRLINQKNSGAAVARNNGLKYAKGEYTLILDADDLYTPDMLQVLVSKAKETSAEIVFCRAVGFNTVDNSEMPMQWSLLTDKISKNPFNYKDLGVYLYSFAKGWSWDKLYSTKLILRSKLQFQDLQNTNDAFFVFSTFTRAQSMAYVEDVLVKHRRNDSSSISNNRVKNWYCFYQAISAIKTELEHTGVYSNVERAFVNWVLDFVLWYVRTEPYPLKNYLYVLLKDAIFDEFNINGHSVDYYVNKEDYELYLSVMSIPLPKETKDRLQDFYSKKIEFDINSLADLVQIDRAGIEIKNARRNSGKTNTVIPIALSCNENYAKYTATTIASIIDNIGLANKYEIYVLHTGLAAETIKKLEKIKGVNYSVKCINVEKNLPPEKDLYFNEHITKEAYYRFCIPEVVKYSKVIYIDCDLVVLDDIANLYYCDTKGAAISGINNFMNKGTYAYVKDTLKIAPEKYINSGVLLIDTQKYREKKIKEQFVSLVKNNYRFMDQDIINIICKDEITLLPDKWNYQWHNHNEKKNLMAKQKEYDAIAANPSILHFTTRRKAWNTPEWELAERFWYYAAKTEFFEDIISSNADAVKSAKYDVRNVPDWRVAKSNSGENKNENLDMIIGVYASEAERLANELKACKADLNNIHHSKSFKIGRAVTWLPRKIRSLFRHLKHDGLKYVVIRVFCGRKKAEEYKKKKMHSKK